jgi:hypothetical protein
MNTITTTRPGLIRRAWLTLCLWSLVYRVNSAVRYLDECERAGITEGRNLTEYHRQIDAMLAEMRAIDEELSA